MSLSVNVVAFAVRTGESTLFEPSEVPTRVPERTVWSGNKLMEFVSSDALGNMLVSKAPPWSVVIQKRRGARVKVGSAP
jgi:hypothetical protein